VERSPIQQLHGLIALSVAGLQISLARLAVVDAEARFALDRQDQVPALAQAFEELLSQ
jgi:hypothetical protein